MSALTLAGLIALGVACHQAANPGGRLQNHRLLLGAAAIVLAIALVGSHPFMTAAVAIVGVMAARPGRGGERGQTVADDEAPTPSSPPAGTRTERERARDAAYDALSALLGRGGEVATRAALIGDDLRVADDEREDETAIAGYRQALQIARTAAASPAEG